MTALIKTGIPVLLLVIAGCKPMNTPLFAKDRITENEKKNTLFLFVGEKITVEEFAMSENAVDRGFKAKYRILQGVYGDYPNPTIEFLAYDHYGWPGFSNYINSLLFVSQHNKNFTMKNICTTMYMRQSMEGGHLLLMTHTYNNAGKNFLHREGVLSRKNKR